MSLSVQVCARITSSSPIRRVFVPDDISRKELKQDKIKEKIEHGAEAVISHGQFALIVVIADMVTALSYGGWKFYIDRQAMQASRVFDDAMKGYSGRIRSAHGAADPIGSAYSNEGARAPDALQTF